MGPLTPASSLPPALEPITSNLRAMNIRKFLLHTVLYTAIALALYWLYSPRNEHPNNTTGSSAQFIYQQF